MIIKFCYQNEIHRSSNPPTDFQTLPTFLVNMFKTELPQRFALQYITPESEALPLTEDVYEQLKSLASAKPFKVVIVDENPAPQIDEEVSVIEKPASADDFEVLDNKAEPEKQAEPIVEQPVENKVEEAPVLDEKVEKQVEDEIVNRLAEDLTKASMEKFEGMAVDEAHVKAVVSETLRDMMPLIIAHVKDTLQNQHGFKFEQNQRQQARPSGYYDVEYGQDRVPRTESFIPFVSNEQLDNFVEKGKEFLNKTYNGLKKVPEHLSKVPEHLSKVPEHLSKVPQKLSTVPQHIENGVNKLGGAFDTLSQKMSGDPYVVCAEGRYPKSVVERGYRLKEIFVEEDTKSILEFVSHMPKESSLEQLADVFAAYKQMKEKPENQENQENAENAAPAEQ
jgi:hypothetical protein